MAASSRQAVLKETDANIDYEPGVEMTLELTKPLTWTGCAPNVRPVHRAAQGIRYHQYSVFG
jgi:hypothetical protein